MATQLAPTPTLYGKDAEAVLKQIQNKPPKEKIDKMKKALSDKFAGIEKRGLR